MSKAASRSLIVLTVALALGLLAYPKLKPGAKAPQAGSGAPATSPSGSSAPGSAPGSKAAPRGPGAPPMAPLPVTGKVLHPERNDNRIASTGTVLANEEVEIRSEVQGKIRRVAFKEGGRVKKGDLLVKIDDAELQAQVLRTQYQRKLAEDNEYRMRMQLKIEAVSQKDYDQAMSELNMAKAGEQLLRAQLAKTELRAPFSGVLGLKFVSEGGFVSPATRITTLQEINPVKLDFSIPGKYAGRVKPGQAIRFTIQGSDMVHEGKIYAVDPRIDPETRSLQLRALCPNPDEKILPGSFAAVEIPFEAVDSALMVPTEALSADGRGAKVFLYRDGKAEPRPVQAGLRTDSAVQITSGLSAGDTVITSGIVQIRPGAPVTLSIID